MSDQDIGAAFRALHYEDKAFLIPNPWDVGSAKIMEGLGFRALATTSSGFAASIGKLDGGVTRDEAIDHCRDLVAATPLPVSADLENGYGDRPEDAAETVRQAIDAGLAGCSIEDYSGEAIYEFDHALERVVAAIEAARAAPRDFVLTARAENLIRNRPDIDDTIKRLQAFDEAGADVLYAPGLRDIQTIEKVCAAVSKPVNVLVGGTSEMTVDQISAAGAKRISVGGGLTWPAYGAMATIARGMLEDGRFDYGDTPGMGGVAKLMGYGR